MSESQAPSGSGPSRYTRSARQELIDPVDNPERIARAQTQPSSSASHAAARLAFQAATANLVATTETATEVIEPTQAQAPKDAVTVTAPLIEKDSADVPQFPNTLEKTDRLSAKSNQEYGTSESGSTPSAKTPVPTGASPGKFPTPIVEALQSSGLDLSSLGDYAVDQLKSIPPDQVNSFANTFSVVRAIMNSDATQANPVELKKQLTVTPQSSDTSTKATLPRLDSKSRGSVASKSDNPSNKSSLKANSNTMENQAVQIMQTSLNSLLNVAKKHLQEFLDSQAFKMQLRTLATKAFDEILSDPDVVTNLLRVLLNNPQTSDQLDIRFTTCLADYAHRLLPQLVDTRIRQHIDQTSRVPHGSPALPESAAKKKVNEWLSSHGSPTPPQQAVPLVNQPRVEITPTTPDDDFDHHTAAESKYKKSSKSRQSQKSKKKVKTGGSTPPSSSSSSTTQSDTSTSSSVSSDDSSSSTQSSSDSSKSSDSSTNSSDDGSSASSGKESKKSKKSRKKKKKKKKKKKTKESRKEKKERLRLKQAVNNALQYEKEEK